MTIQEMKIGDHASVTKTVSETISFRMKIDKRL